MDDGMQIFCDLNVAVYNLKVGGKYVRQDHNAMEVCMGFNEDEWQANCADTLWSMLEDTMSMKSQKKLLPFTIFGNAFLQAVDDSYVKHLQKLIVEQVPEPDKEWSQQYDDAMEVYLDEVLQAVDAMVQLMDDEVETGLLPGNWTGSPPRTSRTSGYWKFRPVRPSVSVRPPLPQVVAKQGHTHQQVSFALRQLPLSASLTHVMGDIYLTRLLQLTDETSPALRQLTLGQVVQFLTLAARLKNDIILTQPATVLASDPPDVLPPTVNSFLSDCCDISSDSVDRCWDVLKDVVWHGRDIFRDNSDTAFVEYGHRRGLSVY
jgi:hypothetical protein